MNKRTVFTKLWVDDWFSNLSRAGKLLFVYTITNQFIGFSGIYECPDRQIMFDTGLNATELSEAKQEISPKVVFLKGWVYVKNAQKLDPIKGDNNPLQKAFTKELDIVPQEVLQELKAPTEGLPRGYEAPQVKERIGKGNKGESVRGESQEPVRVAAERLISVFNQAFSKQYSLTPDRLEKIKTRLSRFEESKLTLAVKKLSLSPFHTGQNDRKWAADPDWLFRNDENIDKALNLNVSEPSIRRPKLADMVRNSNENL